MTYDDLLTRLEQHARPARAATSPRARLRDALPRRARRRVPGHRPGAVGDHADRVRRRRRDAGADRRPEAGDLRVPRRRRLRLHRSGADRRRASATLDGQLAQRPGADRRLRRAVRRRASSGTRGSSTAGPRRGRQPRAAADRRAAARRRCASASCTATTDRRHDRSGYAQQRLARRARRRRRRGRHRRPALLRRADRAPRGRRRALGRDSCGPAHIAVLVRTQPPGGARARRARGGGRPGGDQRRRQRVRHRAGARLAAPAGGDRAPDLGPARPRGGADPVPRLGRRAGGRGRRWTRGRRSTAACTSGRGCCARRASRR